jgi:hypothetical protein
VSGPSGCQLFALADDQPGGALGTMVCPFDLTDVFSATVDMLGDLDAAVVLANPTTGRISTHVVFVDAVRLKGLTDPEFHDLIDQQASVPRGSYSMSASVVRISEAATRVTLRPFIVLYMPGTMNDVGGYILPSIGTLEREHLLLLAQRLRR